MSDNIVFPCPACGTKYSVGPHHAGKKTKCKKCGAPVTVPSPEVANPTIVGGTRTIRRADIDPGASAREEAAASAGAPEVDMKGGASVLRKDETVIGSPPVAPATRGPHRPAPHGGGAGGPAPRPAPGRPMPPGMGPPQKKNNTPLIIGAVGGGVGLILVIVLIVAFSGGGDGGGATDGGTVATTDDGGTAGAQEGEKERLLKEMRGKYNNHAALNLSEIRHYYDQAREHASEDADFRSLRDNWATELIRRAESEASAKEMAEIALELDDAGHPDARNLLNKACQAMQDNKLATTTVRTRDENGNPRNTLRPDPTFMQVIERLGWQPYKRPQKMNEYTIYEVEGAKEYDEFFNFDIKQVYRDVDRFPPELIEQLNELEKKAKESYDKLAADNAQDGFAFAARSAWIRFKDANAKGGKVDRVKDQRPFSPKAMERENEDFEKIWTYTYWKPFVVFIEKPIGQDVLDDDFVRSLESKAALLRNLSSWFRENLIDEFNLQRQKPQYNAKQAEEEGWPLEIVVLKDSYTFESFVEDVEGRRIPGARAFYSPLNERVMTWDDTENLDEETQWFNESVLIHETFHMLSDFYAADPKFTMEELQAAPRYVNILVQEGLTDSVSGFTRKGEGGSASYDFLQLNHLRLRSFQNLYKQLGDRTIFRIRDMLECRSYGQCQQVGVRRALEMGLNPRAVAQSAVGIFYPSACVVSYFFHTYKDGGSYPYKDKWWEYIGANYTGDLNLTSYADTSAIARFKEIFDIDSDADWDALEKEWLDYTMGLDPEDVGKSGGGDDVDIDDECAPYKENPLPPEALIPTGKKSAHAGREDDE